MDEQGGGSGIEVWRSRGEDLAGQTELQKCVWEEIGWEPLLEGADLTVEVTDAAVTIRGVVCSCLARRAAERAVARVPGVQVIRSELCVYLPAELTRTDAELAAEARQALEWNVAVPADRLIVAVDSGRVTLEGEVDREGERTAVEEIVAGLAGVRDLVNRVRVRPVGVGPPAPELRRRVAAALEHAGVRPRHFAVDLEGDRIVLRGRVHTLAERDAAEHAARAVPGVRALEDRLQIGS